jgi:dGTPase
MEIERIYQGLKVDRAGGEQQRRRRQEQQDFGDLLESTARRLAEAGCADLAAVRASPRELVGFSETMRERKEAFEAFLYKNFYQDEEVRGPTRLWESRLRQLFAAYRAHPELLPLGRVQRAEERGEKVERVICDYVAGMTDRYAERQWNQLCG